MYSEINLHRQSIFFQHLFDGEQRCMRLRTHFCKSNCSRWRNQDSTSSSRTRYGPDHRGRGNYRGTVLAYALLRAIRHHLACYEVWDVTCAIIEDRERRNFECASDFFPWMLDPWTAATPPVLQCHVVRNAAVTAQVPALDLGLVV